MSNAVTEKQHKPLSASTTERWWKCPGSIQLSKSAPPQLPNKYAAEGTYAHQCAELDLKLRLGQQTKEDTHLWAKLQNGGEVDGFKFEFTQELRNAIEDYSEYVLNLLDKYKIKNEYVQTEQVFDVPGNDALGGTSDCFIHVPYRRIIVIDFKYGAGKAVEVEANKQLMTYAVGAYFSLFEADRKEIQTIELVIFQPRVIGGVKHWKCSVEELLSFHSELLEKAALTVETPNVYQAGDHCRYCPALLGCKTNEEYRLDKTGIEFAAVPVENSYLQLSPERIAEIYLSIPVVENYIKEFKQYAIGQAINGAVLPGLVLKENLGNRKWMEGAESVLTSHFGDEAFTKTIKSPAQIDKLCKAKKVKPVFDSICTREVTSQTLVADNGKHVKIEVLDPFVAIKAEEEF